MTLRRGQVVWVNFDPVRGNEQAGHRPAVVVSSDDYNRLLPHLAIVVPLTTSLRGTWPNHVPIADWQAAGLSGACVAMTEQPTRITTQRITRDSAGDRVDEATMRLIDQWLRDFLALN